MILVEFSTEQHISLWRDDEGIWHAKAYDVGVLENGAPLNISVRSLTAYDAVRALADAMVNATRSIEYASRVGGLVDL